MIATEPDDLLRASLEHGRVHSAYLLSGPAEDTRAAALRFVRALVCRGTGERPCETCPSCHRSGPREEIAIDGEGKTGPYFRHVGDHPDLYWVERGADDTRVRIDQVRALRQALRLRSHEGGFRAAVIADAELLNKESQNALLRVLEEPPPDTALLLLAATASALLPTVRSRCVRVPFVRPERRVGDLEAEPRDLAERLAGAGRLSVAELLDWAEAYRGGRAESAAAVSDLLETGGLVLRDLVGAKVGEGAAVRPALDAFRTLEAARKALVQRNANPQMVAERALLALHGALR